MTVNMIKLVVGVESLEEFWQIQQASTFDYNGVAANAVWTRYKAKRADEILESRGSIYRVIKNKICCRQRILGFEMVETQQKGTQCMIMVEPEIVQTYSTPKRPFQGWRYLQEKDVPMDKGLYLGGGDLEDIPPELENELRESGLL